MRASPGRVDHPLPRHALDERSAERAERDADGAGTARLPEYGGDLPVGHHLAARHAPYEAVHEAMWGLTSGKKHPELGFPILDQFRVFSAADVIPPEGRKTIEWIESWATRK